MNEKTIRLLIDLTYDPESMHGDDEDSTEWFNNLLLGDHLQLGDFGDLGDMVGSVKVVSQAADRIEELEKRINDLSADKINLRSENMELKAKLAKTEVIK